MKTHIKGRVGIHDVDLEVEMIDYYTESSMRWDRMLGMVRAIMDEIARRMVERREARNHEEDEP